MESPTHASLEAEKWKRYSLSPIVQMWNDVMSGIVRAGGIFVIICVAGILLFIAAQVFPLAMTARVKSESVVELPHGSIRLMGISQDGVHWWALGEGGDFLWNRWGEEGWQTIKSEWADDALALSWDASAQTFLLARRGGQLQKVHLSWSGDGPVFTAASVVELPIEQGMVDQDFEIIDLDYGSGNERRLTAVLLRSSAGYSQLFVSQELRRRTLMGGEAWSAPSWRFVDSKNTDYTKVLVPRTGDSILALRSGGQVDYFFVAPEGDVELRQSFLALQSDEEVSAWGFAFGDVSLVVGGASGEMQRWSLARSQETGVREFIRTGSWASLGSSVSSITGNQRNKSILISGENDVEIVTTTTGDIRWKSHSRADVKFAAWDDAGKKMIVLRGGNLLSFYKVHDPHPESSLKAFFGKVWYEGRSEPGYIWQSTSGTDDFEPKLSLIPLILGSLKGVFYSLLVALPLSLAGALYVSQIMRPAARSIIKPSMEWMASIPSVVLGFVGALWVAPLLAPKIPSLLLLIWGVPLGVAAVALLWGHLMQGKCGFWTGREWMFALPLALAVGWVCWTLGPVAENLFFLVPSADAVGQAVGDFRTWWREVVGLSFEQRNAFVVGLMMGFAVIPIIFSIAEDAFTNVPNGLKSGAEALGASRWQVAWGIVLPVAFSGVFSAVMIGMGRAIGETMIVVMVSGNTAILDWNPFSGMRPLSANIAVEMPEAARESTHYRVLFLSAFVLFVMCFALNTVAELVRQSFRKRMKAL